MSDRLVCGAVNGGAPLVQVIGEGATAADGRIGVDAVSMF